MGIAVIAVALAASLIGAPWEAEKPARAVFDVLDTYDNGQQLLTGSAAANPGTLAWGESYLLMSYVRMYEATGETKYLDKFVGRFRAVLSLRDDKKERRDVLRNRVMPAWGTGDYTNGKWSCWNVHAGMITYPAARFARLVKERKGLEAYAGAAREFTAAIEETVAAYDPEWHDGPNPDEGYYAGPSLGGKHLPLNQQNAIGRTCIELAEVTGKAAYRERASKLAAFFKRRLKLRDDGAYEWAYWAALQPPYEQGREDISHAAINIDFAFRCYEAGIVFTREDMERFAATFLKVVRKPDGRISDTVAGAGSGRYAAQIGRWGALASIQPEVARVIREYFFRQDPPLEATTTMLGLAHLAAFEETGKKN